MNICSKEDTHMARKHTELRSASLSTGERGPTPPGDAPHAPRGAEEGLRSAHVASGPGHCGGQSHRPSDVRQRRALPES